MKRTITVLAAAGLLAAGCGTSAPATTAPATTAPATTAPATTAPPTQAPLTVPEAAKLYLRLVAPANRAEAVVNYDAKAYPQVSFAQYVRDDKRWLAQVQAQAARLRSVRWPASVQPYITAMLLTFEPATRACFTAEDNAPSQQAGIRVQQTSPSCRVSLKSDLPAEVRRALHLPPAP
jgi:hypothetical protein